ncbi:MAG: TolB family protein [Planctomycetota bacterium]|jgi:Tol biopolymer transport system component
MDTQWTPKCAAGPAARLALFLLCGAGGLLGQAPALVERASVTSLGEQGDLASVAAAISADGSVVAFSSSARNLVDDDLNDKSDVFVHDRVSGHTTRVSVASDGTEADLWSYNPAISADGRVVVFESDATNLVAGDTNRFTDIFVHDRETGRTQRVSVGTHGQQAELPSFSPAVSADGTIVAWQSYSKALVAGGNPGLQEIFVRDLVAGLTTRASVTPAGLQGNGSSWSPAISGDGRFVAFSSQATDLVPGDFNGAQDIFVHDRVLGVTRIASVTSAGAQATSTSLDAALSGDGRYVAYLSWAKNLVPGDTNNHTDVFVHDRITATTVRASVSTLGEQGDNHSGKPRLSWDGRFVAFHSHAVNLVDGDTNGQQDVFLRDMRAGRTWRASVNEEGVEGNVLSLLPDITADGRSVVFESHAHNLVPGDTNAEGDVFVVTPD